MTAGRARVALAAAFVATRALAWLAGVRYDRGSITGYMHYLDPSLLRDDLVGSVWYLHMQPPLFNAYVGSVLQLPGALQAPTFTVVAWAGGLLLALATAELLVELGVPRLGATVAAGLFMASPAALLYEHWLFYTHPVAVALVSATAALARWLRTARPAWGAMAFGGFAVVALLRSSFHLLWLLGVVAIVVVVRGRPLRATVVVAVPALLVVGGWYLKNAAVVGEPRVTMWQGMNLALETTLQLPEDEREELVADGVLSPLALLYPFQPLSAYRGLIELPDPTGVPALDDPTKADGTPNFNNLGYIAVDDAYRRDAITVARREPGLLLDGVRASAATYLTTAADYAELAENRRAIGPWNSLYSIVVEGRLGTRTPLRPGLPSARPGVGLVVLYLAAAWGAVVAAWRFARCRGAVDDATVVRVVIGFTVLCQATASLLVGSVENNRFRYEVDPVVLALALATAWSVVLARRLRTSDDDPPSDGSRRPSSSRRSPSPG